MDSWEHSQITGQPEMGELVQGGLMGDAILLQQLPDHRVKAAQQFLGMVLEEALTCPHLLFCDGQGALSDAHAIAFISSRTSVCLPLPLCPSIIYAWLK